MTVRLGILGDSNWDEYRANDNRGGANTFNGIELLVRYRGVDCGPWGAYAEPRRTGYAYNWARSGATTGSLISQGQHTGLAAQCEAGLVDYVFMEIGANDWRPDQGTYANIYDGTMSDAALAVVISNVIQSYTTAVNTILATPIQGMILATFLEILDEEQIAQMYPNREGRLRVWNAARQVNNALWQLASDRLKVVDLNEVYRGIPAYGQGVDSTFEYWGETMNSIPSNDPHSMLIGDGTHWGTVISGIRANELIVKPLRDFGVEITPLHPAELWMAAGVHSAGVYGSITRL